MRFPPVKVLGIIAVIGAPWVMIDFINNGLYDRFQLTSVSGIRCFFFITGWICSILGLYKLHEPMSRARKLIFSLLLFFLSLANVWNVMEVFNPYSHSEVFFLLNFSWPLSGLLMVITSILITRSNKIRGWKKWMPLVASLWFPQTMFMALTGQQTFMQLIGSGMYSAISFGLMGFSLIAAGSERVEAGVFA